MIFLYLKSQNKFIKIIRFLLYYVIDETLTYSVAARVINKITQTFNCKKSLVPDYYTDAKYAFKINIHKIKVL